MHARILFLSGKVPAQACDLIFKKRAPFLNELFDAGDALVKVGSWAGPTLAIQGGFRAQLRFPSIQKREELFGGEFALEQDREAIQKLSDQFRFAEKPILQPIPSGNPRLAPRPQEHRQFGGTKRLIPVIS
jgi:hypothetical protein